MILEKRETVFIGIHFMPALINDDVSGLSDEEDEQVCRYMAGCECGFSHFDYEGETVWSTCKITGLSSDCYEVSLYYRMYEAKG